MEVPKHKPLRLKGNKLMRLIVVVWERDEYSCQGKDCPGGFPLDYRPHHIIFKSQSGEDTMDNLITLCTHCHGRRHGINVVRS